MAKSQLFNFTQNLNNPSIYFTSADLLNVITVAPNSNGSNLTTGTQTFTAAAGTIQTGGSACIWTAPVTDSRIVGVPTITNVGQYTVTPTASANAATVGSGSSNATWNLNVGILKTLYTASSNDAVVKAINVTSTDTAARILSLWMSDSTNGQNWLIGSINIPLGSGNAAGTTYTIDLLSGAILTALPYDSSGKRVLPMKAGYVLKVSVPAVTAAYLIAVTACVEEY